MQSSWCQRAGSEGKQHHGAAFRPQSMSNGRTGEVSDTLAIHFCALTPAIVSAKKNQRIPAHSAVTPAAIAATDEISHQRPAHMIRCSHFWYATPARYTYRTARCHAKHGRVHALLDLFTVSVCLRNVFCCPQHSRVVNQHRRSPLPSGCCVPVSAATSASAAHVIPYFRSISGGMIKRVLYLRGPDPFQTSTCNASSSVIYGSREGKSRVLHRARSRTPKATFLLCLIQPRPGSIHHRRGAHHFITGSLPACVTSYRGRFLSGLALAHHVTPVICAHGGDPFSMEGLLLPAVIA